MKEHSIKAIKEEFKNKGVFYTPPELSEYLKSLVDKEIKNVYDPTCGRGNLLSVFGDEIKKYGQELNPTELENAKILLKNFEGYCGDTLVDDKFKGFKFDCIVANPPFSINWEPPANKDDDVRFINSPAIPTKSKADFAFILHIIHHLEDDGIAVALEFPGILYRGNKEGEIRKWLVEQNYIEKVISIPGNTFTDTSIGTCVLVFKKNKKNTNVEFIDKENNLSKIVSFKEIEENNFNLSVSTYVQIEIEKEKTDPLELEEKARTDFLIYLEKQLMFSKFVSEMEKIEFEPFIKEIEKVLKKFKAPKIKPKYENQKLIGGGSGA